jgi:hypothetical protein
MEMFDRTELRELLHNNVVNILFEKVDGTVREMRCTLMPNYILTEHKETLVPRKQNDDVLSVWDLENNGWRSFRIDSVKSVKVQENAS